MKETDKIFLVGLILGVFVVYYLEKHPYKIEQHLLLHITVWILIIAYLYYRLNKQTFQNSDEKKSTLQKFVFSQFITTLILLYLLYRKNTGKKTFEIATDTSDFKTYRQLLRQQEEDNLINEFNRLHLSN